MSISIYLFIYLFLYLFLRFPLHNHLPLAMAEEKKLTEFLSLCFLLWKSLNRPDWNISYWKCLGFCTRSNLSLQNIDILPSLRRDWSISHFWKTYFSFTDEKHNSKRIHTESSLKFRLKMCPLIAGGKK